MISQETCEVDNKAQFNQAVSSCNCADITSEVCELSLGQGGAISCKSGASDGCKASVNDWENAYKNIANPESCKASEIVANGC